MRLICECGLFAGVYGTCTYKQSNVCCISNLFADTNGTLANSSKGKMTVKEEVEELGTIESERQDNRQLEKENLDVKLLKKRPKSEGFEMFEKKGIVIGVVSGSDFRLLHMLAVM